MRKGLSAAAGLVGIAIVVACESAGPMPDDLSTVPVPPVETSAPVVEVVVSRVIDGDTLDVTEAGVVTRVRLVGIDTPEKRPVECYGREATARTTTLTGRAVTLVRDTTQANTDRYGRLLRYVEVDGVDWQRQLITEGLARELTVGRGHSRQAVYRAVEADARDRGVGMWGACTTG